MHIKESIDHLLGMQDSRFASNFYHALFTKHPELQVLFAGADWNRQRMMLMMSLQITVYHYRVPNPTMRVYLLGLGAGHRERGVQTADYAKWKNVLLEVLNEHHGADWSPELQREWTSAIDQAIDLMMTGSRNLHSEGERTWVY